MGIILNFENEKTTLFRCIFATPLPHSPVALSQHLLYVYNSGEITTPVALIQHIPWILVWFWLTGDFRFTFYYGGLIWILNPSMTNGAMPPRVFPGLGRLLDRVFACRKGIYCVEKCEKVQKSATFFWF